MPLNQNNGYGAALLSMVQNQLGVFGNVFVVMNAANTDEGNYKHMQDVMKSDTDGRIRFYTDLATAYAATESNNNDVILLDANSSHSLTTTLTVSKSRVNFIGMDGGDRLVQQGAKVQNSGNPAEATVIKVTGTRCSFRNIKFIQTSTDAAALNVLQEGSEGALYKNCSFVFGVADQLDETTSSEVLCGSDSATFLNCHFGADTLLTSAARTVFKIDQVTASQEFKSNVIKDCIFTISSSDADALFISMAAAGDILYTNLFINPIFQASVDTAGGIALTKGVTTANGNTKGTINLYNPCAFNVTDVGVNGTNNDGLQAYGAASTGTDLVGLAPTAT